MKSQGAFRRAWGVGLFCAAFVLVGLGASAEAGAAAKKSYTMGISVADVKGPWFLAILYGAMDEAKKRGHKVVLLEAGGYNHPEKQVTQMEDLITRRVDGILADPIDDKAIVPLMQDALKKGIKSVGFGVPISDPQFPYVGTDHVDIGKQMAKVMREALRDKGNVVVLGGPAGASWSTLRVKGFEEGIKGSGLKVLATQWSDHDRAVVLKLTEDMLQRFPNVDAFYTADNGVGLGAADAVTAAGKVGKVKIITAVVDHDTIRAIQKDAIAVSIAQQPVLIGRMAVQVLEKVLNGEKVQRWTQVGTITVTKANAGKLDTATMAQPEGWRP